MITLKHLQVERFRLLRHIDLHFPQRGSILIQGSNEAGKSALLEGIYFALYGEPFQFNHDRRSLDELISYGATDAKVTLSLNVDTTDLTITRTLERGRGQRVTVNVYHLDHSTEETVTQLNVANARIIAELGDMDGAALRNSCLIEQKGLDRLELLHGVEREQTVRKLLGLERMKRIGEQFELTPSDERQMEDTTQRLRLAEVQDRVPIQSKELETLEIALDVVSVAEDLTVITQQEAEITEQEVSLEAIHTRRSELKSKQNRVQQLKRAEITLNEIIHSYDRMAEAHREMPLLERQIAELERREEEELPALEKRVTDLVELTKSFGTLQRMSNDLLTTVDTIKDLEQDLKQQGEVEDDLKGIDIEVEHARRHVGQAQQALDEQQERLRVGRPFLETRLTNLQTLAARLGELRLLEERYAQHRANKKSVDESEPRLKKLLHDLRATEQELALVEAEAKQVQQEAEVLERRGRQLSVRRQLEEWQRLKGLSQGLNDAEQHVRAAYDQQAQLTEAAAQARQKSTKFMGIVVSCVVLFIFASIGTAVEFAQHSPIVAIILGILALLLVAGGGLSFQNYSRAQAEKQTIDTQVQEAMSRVRMMVAAREAASRMGGNNEALEQVEGELRTLTGTIPRSIAEAQSLLQQTQAPQNENMAALQEQTQKKRGEANAAQNQVNVTMEAVANLRKQYAQLEEQRNNITLLEEQLREDQMALGRMHQEITLLAGQENLPQASVNARLKTNSTFDAYAAIPLTPVLWNEEESKHDVPTLDALIENTIKATEHEIASLDGKADLIQELTHQVSIHQHALDVMLTRRRIVEERIARYQTNSPMVQIERAREQQRDLRSALQSLQESLRLRVKPLGVTFGQAAIANAEVTARRDLEQLNTILGGKFALQDKLATYAALLKERQESLAEHYKQLAKFSNSLGSWIVPPNPFADALVALRTRCQQELADANESAIAQELESLVAREGATNARISLCHQEIEDAQDRISAMLIKRNRPLIQHYTFTQVIAVWPLVGDYTDKDRARLEQAREQAERTLESLEQQELTLSTSLQTGGVKFDLALARAKMAQQERSYQVKKRSSLLINAVHDRLMSKILPHTEYYMQHILPLLTSGRYHDVQVTTFAEEGTISGGPLQLKVWDSNAGEYVNKSALSGGAADQLSLALRLSFAIATQPKEQEMAPGFLCLDEPLSSFDRGRTHALMDALTDTKLSRHFQQILLVSHSSAFDPTLFNHHIYIENGTISESTLPVVETPITHHEAMLAEELQEEDTPDDMTVRVPAIGHTKVAAE